MKKKILVIEDEKLSRNNLIKILRAEAFEPIGAENGATAIQLAIEQEPDVIICDIMMPEMDGYEVLKVLRQEPSTLMIPFIFLTAKTERADMRQGMNLGADDYLTKPFEIDELLEAIATRLKRQELLEKHAQVLIEQLQQSPDINTNLADNLAWDIEKLYSDLAEVKQKQKNAQRQMRLTQLEKACLLEILSGHSPSFIASQLNRQPNGLAVDLSRGLYRYIEGLTGQKPKNWRDIPLLLSQKGYLTR
ncbi:MAG: response regulator [Scytonematopsis contorta HA4267-MV1]|jgi:DNA-binding response OmpR family regulator|nr:response regulator [Scytonematopsis contorta HA4267-MV1]